MTRRVRGRWVGRVLLVVGVTLMILAPAMAGAQENYPISTSTTDPCTQNCGTQVTVKGASTTLPFTGGDVALLTGLGLVTVGAGTGLVIFGRRDRRAKSGV